ncbi:hypothetical protein R5W24_004448 [Gemmata sp. JC717]|uniref:hypothetical protein n=1 Tax=Gemmata algarum TaxID=2975278 RepID=UPI0021BAA8CC|nr:hypothetical protein [Gemmata algarum]MDY3555307.1 hypothetical protein [Gemmata algarum]
MNLFAKARDWLTAQLEEAAGEPITYTRGNQTFALTAVVGQTLVSESEEGPARVAVSERDYLIAAAGFPFATPAIGDVIGQTVGGVPLVFSIQSTDSGDPAWRYSDQTRAMWLIHVKRKKGP